MDPDTRPSCLRLTIEAANCDVANLWHNDETVNDNQTHSSDCDHWSHADRGDSDNSDDNNDDDDKEEKKE